MIEKHLILDEIDVVSFYGQNNRNLTILKSLFPKLRITARGSVLHIIGEKENIDIFEQSVDKLSHHLLIYNNLDEKSIIDIINGKDEKGQTAGGAIVFNIDGKPIKPRSNNQQHLVEGYNNNDMVFALGPAGTGKTYLSIALAVKSLKEKEVKKIILSRPAVEAGEKLGFLPGDMKEKIDPYLQPLYDALEDMIPSAKLQTLIEKRIIEIAPLAFMRGRTLNNAVVILDEAQNTTKAQLKMFLTRMGQNTKMIITGDLTQVDLPRNVSSGLKSAVQILKDVEGIQFIEMSRSDIVRHKLVDKIVAAYEQNEEQQEL